MSERRAHLDALRMLAIFFVVMNHTGYSGQLAYLELHELPIHWLLMGLSALHKTAVPLFLMCSGALLIGREESLAELFRKRVLRFALVLLLFSLLGYLYTLYTEGKSFNLYYFVTTLYSYRLVDAYWYLYCYLGYLLVLPFLRRMARAMSDREYLYMAALWLVFKGIDLLPIFLIEDNLYLTDSFVLFILEYTVFFPLMGYWLEKRLDDRFFTAKNALLAALAALLSILLMCLATERWCRLNQSWPAEVGELYFGALNFVAALALFFIAKTLFLRRTPGAWALRLMAVFSGCSFGVYLLQHLLLGWTRPLFTALSPVLGRYPACVVWVLGICLAGTAVTLLLKQIPGLKKLL